MKNVFPRLERRHVRGEKLGSVDTPQPFQFVLALLVASPPNEVGILNHIASALQLDDDSAITQRVNEAARLRLMPHAGVGRFVCGHARFVKGADNAMTAW